MKTISVKVPVSLRITKIVRDVAMKIVRDIAMKIVREVAMKVSHHSLTIVISGVAMSYLGCLLSIDAVMYAGALMALVAIHPSEEE